MSEPGHPEKPRNHDQLIEYSRELVSNWNQFLEHVQKMVREKDPSLAEKRKPIEEGKWFSQLPDESSSVPTITVLSSSGGILRGTEEEIMDSLFVRANTEIRTEKNLACRIKTYLESAADPGLAQLYRDFLATATVMDALLSTHLSTKQQWLTDFQRRFVFDNPLPRYDGVADPRDVDLDVGMILSDNVRTTLDAVQLLTGDSNGKSVEDLLDLLHYSLTQKPSKAISTRYPNLPLIGYLGICKFSTVATCRSQGVLLRADQTNLEEQLDKLTHIEGNRDPKKWGGCPAIAIIPKTLEVFLELMAGLFPERYEISTEGKVNAKKV